MPPLLLFIFTPPQIFRRACALRRGRGRARASRARLFLALSPKRATRSGLWLSLPHAHAARRHELASRFSFYNLLILLISYSPAVKICRWRGYRRRLTPPRKTRHQSPGLHRRIDGRAHLPHDGQLERKDIVQQPFTTRR